MQGMNRLTLCEANIIFFASWLGTWRQVMSANSTNCKNGKKIWNTMGWNIFIHKDFHKIPYAPHHNLLLIINRSWILTVHKDRILRKKLKNGVINIQTAGYNGARTVFTVTWVEPVHCRRSLFNIINPLPHDLRKKVPNRGKFYKTCQLSRVSK